MRAHQAARRWAWGIAGVVFASQVGLLWFVVANLDGLPAHVDGAVPLYAVSAVLVPLFSALAAVILARHPRHPVGWIMCAVPAFVVVDAAARWYAYSGLYLEPGRLPAPEYAAWLANWNWFPSMMVLLFFVPLLFPDGHVPGPRWRPVAIVGGIWIGVASLGLAFSPTELVDFPGVEAPLQRQPAMVLGVLMLLTPVALGLSFASVVVRRRRAVGDEREQLRWLVFALAITVVGWTAMFVRSALGFGWDLISAALSIGPIVLLPVAITVAMVKYRLYDIDVLINRSLVYGGLTGAVLGVYGVVVLAVSSATNSGVEWRWSVLVVAAVAVLAYPLREWLQRRVNRFMYGERDEPGRAMSRLARRVGDSVSPSSLLPAVAETIGQSLRLPYVAVEVAGGTGRPAASYGTRRGEPHRLELVHQGEAVGTLLLGRRAETEQFSAADERVLDDVARQVAVVAHAVRLSEDLQRSRERLVLAREEERRRLRRDLHDGVGSALAGLALQAGNARQALPDSPEEAQRWVGSLEQGIRAAVVDIRRIVDDLRSPALDELGLVGALRERAGAVFPGARVLESDAERASLPAALEVAAYRIATEALANVARHSGASCAEVRVWLDDDDQTLVVEVTDNGAGIPQAPRPGVGLRSMHERAVEVGGTCQVTRRAGGGTRVRATLPLPDEDPPGDAHG